MRKRKEVEEEIKSGRNVPIFDELVLELLLDIRELLYVRRE